MSSEPQVKELPAGIALSRGNNLLSLTLVSNDGVFANPTEHKLQDETPEAVATALSRILSTPTSIALSLPVALTDEENKQYDVVRDAPGMDGVLVHHRPVDRLPQPRVSGRGRRAQRPLPRRDARPNRCESILSGNRAPLHVRRQAPHDTIDKLVTPTIKDLSSLHAIYILCPGGFCAALASASESKLPDRSIRLVTLAKISRGAAAARERN